MTRAELLVLLEEIAVGLRSHRLNGSVNGGPLKKSRAETSS